LEDDVTWTPQERRELALNIRTGAVRLNQIVENLLDLSRIEAGILHPQKDWYDVWALIDDVVGRLRGVAGEHRVVVDVPDDMPPVLLDYVKMAQVLTNLVENAIKYTPAQSEIIISAWRSEHEAFLAVTDSGNGVSEESLSRLFEPFYRGDAAANRPQGAGLGLAVARGLVQAHGGRIWAENRPEGGARFVVALPLSRPGESSKAA
jgi:two-component system sensor histidine kinase KdpD